MSDSVFSRVGLQCADGVPTHSHIKELRGTEKYS